MLCLNDTIIEFGFVRRNSSFAEVPWPRLSRLLRHCVPRPRLASVFLVISVVQLPCLVRFAKPPAVGCHNCVRMRSTRCRTERGAPRDIEVAARRFTRLAPLIVRSSRLPKRYAIFVACAFYVIKIGKHPGATILKILRTQNMTKMQEKHAVNSLAPLWDGLPRAVAEISAAPDCINAWPLTDSHVADQGTIIFGMGHGDPSPCLLRRGGDERFLPRHSDELAASLQQVGPMRLQPVTVAPAPLVLRLTLRNLDRVVITGAFFCQAKVRGNSNYRPDFPSARRRPRPSCPPISIPLVGQGPRRLGEPCPP